MLMKNMPVENIMIAGRWKSLSSCREYLKRGEVFLLRFLEQESPASSAKVLALSRLSSQCLDIRADNFSDVCSRIAGV